MAAVYQTGTQAISATSAVDFRTALDAVIVTHPNWSLVEAISITGGTSRIYKCSGSGGNANSWGQDFYIAITQFTASATQLQFQAFEAYDTGTHQATRAVISAGAATIAAPNANGGYVNANTGYTLDTGTGNVARFQVALDGTSAWMWMCHVSKSRLEISLNKSGGGSETGFVGGLYVPNPRAVSAVASVFPLFAGVAVGSMVALPGGSVPAFPTYSRNFAPSGTVSSGYLAAASPNLAGAISTAGAIFDSVEGVVRGVGLVVTGFLPSSPGNAAGGFLRGSVPALYGFYCNTSSFPRALDLVVLGDGTRLAPLGSGNISALGMTNVDADY